MKFSNQFLFAVSVAAFVLPGTLMADIAGKVTRKKIAGIDVIVYPTQVKDVVTIVGSIPGGDALVGPDRAAVPALTSMMLDKGTKKQDMFAIAAQLEKAGAGLAFSPAQQWTWINGYSLKRDLPVVVALLAEQLRIPAFSAEEFAKVRQQYMGNLRSTLEDPRALASEALARAVFPAGHPNRPYSVQENIDDAQTVTVEELQDFHRRYYGPEHMTLVVVGDVEPAEIHRLVGKAFAGWKGGVKMVRAASRAQARAEGGDVSVPMPGKSSVSVMLGQTSGIDYRHPDAIALHVGTSILGSGFIGRLMSTVRDREGLTYGIGAEIDGDILSDGLWRISASFAPELTDKGIASTRRELVNWWSGGVTERELTVRKRNLIGTFQVSLSTTRGLAMALLNAAHLEYEMSWLEDYPKRIAALSLEQVNGAIQKYLDPDRMVLVKAGTFTVPGPSGDASAAFDDGGCGSDPPADPGDPQAMQMPSGTVLRMVYKDLAAELELPPAKFEQLMDLLAEHQGRQAQGAQVFDGDRSELMRAMEQAARRKETELKNLLGEKYLQYLRYENTWGERRMVQQLGTQLVAAGAPLDERQRKGLMTAIAQEWEAKPRPAWSQGRSQEENIASLQQWSQDYDRRLHERARKLLTSDQLEQYESLRKTQGGMGIPLNGPGGFVGGSAAPPG